MSEAIDNTAVSPADAALATALGGRSIVLVGMMGAGKSAIGRRLATRLGIRFVDADAVIEERAGGMTVAEIFDKYGEAHFRSGEARVIAHLLDEGPQVLATGGGAFMNPDTRAASRAKGISVWRKADLDVLLRRVKRRSMADRPMLRGHDPVERLKELMAERHPRYAEADVTVQSREVSHDLMVDEIVRAVRERIDVAAPAGEGR